MSKGPKKPKRIRTINQNQPAKKEPVKKVETFDRRLYPKSPGQIELLKELCHNQITICIGPAGTGKTCMAVGYAVQHLMARQCDKIILCRPIIPGGGEDMGALPGTAEEKIHPYLIPLLEELKKFASYTEIAELRNGKFIEIVPMSHMRGRNFHSAVVIVDEAQNASMDQLKMVLTRHGQNSKTILIGDVEQSDLVKRIQGGLEQCYNKLKGEPDIGTVALTEADIQRNELIGRVLRRLKE
jgi:phosphate starvation-inducible PhoH-like protein